MALNHGIGVRIPISQPITAKTKRTTSERGRLIAGLTQPPPQAARFLLGQHLFRRWRGRSIGVRIVETEAYIGEGDPAAHAYAGKTARNAPIWGPPGTLYVYFIYGMYYCLNIAVEPEGVAGCVLIPAGEPLPGSRLLPFFFPGPGRRWRSPRLATPPS